VVVSTRYRTIVADPPWPYDQPGMRGLKKDGTRDEGVGSTERYGAMSIDRLCGLSPPAENDAHLYLWTTNSFMVQAHEIAKAWGFKVKTICTYGKVQPDGTPSRKSGYYFRGATEHCLFAVRGSLPLRVSEAQATLWLWPRLPHSVKPDAFFDLVEVCSPGPYLEMFSRRARLGWDVWGNESLGTAEMTA
jgi:N6-adenosine-specific RNA methylase IME4